MTMKKLAAITVILSALAGNAFADIAMCPQKSSIKQQKEAEGWSYSAIGPNGRLWVGENPYAEEEHLETFKFTGALYRDVSSEGNTDVVSCDYEGDDWFAFARLTLYSFKDWASVPGTKWKSQSNNVKDGTHKKAKTIETCESLSQEECAFNYSSLVKPQGKATADN
ncbi:hypothetical protein C1886_17140 [Pseudomonas sp. FW300-N1A1]|uniref:DUF3757 domain-containing protein n=1 Tax=Pseudomonas sp. FW300-N1A1 TaxID=2075555 RepID=UPI000CD2A0DD|nr:DUF3757 domain-containing protein [Pseudomonas sp. FW300-N1A1]POA18433.1 hypothetical protein C1886_17140 [Pseudomonas sp. FW300-N1A1]